MHQRKIGFNIPYFTGKETENILEAVQRQHLSGNGFFTKKVHEFFKTKYGFPFCLMTTSCTDALEMAAILLNIGPGDEVILPSYTFVSTANAFVLRGATPVFVDCLPDYPNIDVDQIATCITPATKAIVAVHYGGAACDMEAIVTLCKKHNLFLVEDAAQAVDGYYIGQPLGSFGDLACFSFHETKNIHCGEGGLLVVNNSQMRERAEIIWEKGTNRSAFFRGQVDKYNWVDIGSSFLPSELNAAFLMAQLDELDFIQSKRKQLWKHYFEALAPHQHLGFSIPSLNDTDSGISHLFFIVVPSLSIRTQLIDHLKSKNIGAVFHYISLHKSPFFYKNQPKDRMLIHSEKFSDTLLRLPFFVGLSKDDVQLIVKHIIDFFENHCEKSS
jgi:dTDP-4-amino-4,6-dideoxygalactose transaminase